jgi:threonine dehydrogenase-like Zn-dependent dehydrogenase
MKAITYQGVESVRYEEVPDPAIEKDGDALVEVEIAAICGSDLHVYHGRETGLDVETVMGHEFAGRVVATGSNVSGLHTGDRVVSPFTTCCGRCFYCSEGLSARCASGQLFGWVEQGAGLNGGQASLVRVPLAATTLFKIPDDLDSGEALLLGDVLPTGYHCATMAGVSSCGTYVVIGCGPVGLMAVLAARELGAGRLYAVDSIAERLSRAARFGATVIDARRDDPNEIVREATGGRGADAVLEAVGSPEAGRLAFELIRPGGTISTVGVHHEAGFPFSPGQAYDKNLTYRTGRCPARSLMETLVPLVRRRRADLAGIFTHRVPLSRGPEAYEIFDRKQDGCIKVALTP